MSDTNLHVEPTPPIRGAAPVQPVRSERPVGIPGDRQPGPDGHSVAASTGGNLRAAYAQFVVNPDTQDVVLRIVDSATDQVISEMPSKEIQAMTAYLRNYLDTLARHKAAQHGTSN